MSGSNDLCSYKLSYFFKEDKMILNDFEVVSTAKGNIIWNDELQEFQATIDEFYVDHDDFTKKFFKSSKDIKDYLWGIHEEVEIALEGYIEDSNMTIKVLDFLNNEIKNIKSEED